MKTYLLDRRWTVKVFSRQEMNSSMHWRHECWLQCSEVLFLGQLRVELYQQWRGNHMMLGQPETFAMNEFYFRLSQSNFLLRKAGLQKYRSRCLSWFASSWDGRNTAKIHQIRNEAVNIDFPTWNSGHKAGTEHTIYPESERGRPRYDILLLRWWR